MWIRLKETGKYPKSKITNPKSKSRYSKVKAKQNLGKVNLRARVKRNF